MIFLATRGRNATDQQGSFVGDTENNCERIPFATHMISLALAGELVAQKTKLRLSKEQSC